MRRLWRWICDFMQVERVQIVSFYLYPTQTSLEHMHTHTHTRISIEMSVPLYVYMHACSELIYHLC